MNEEINHPPIKTKTHGSAIRYYFQKKIRRSLICPGFPVRYIIPRMFSEAQEHIHFQCILVSKTVQKQKKSSLISLCSTPPLFQIQIQA